MALKAATHGVYDVVVVGGGVVGSLLACRLAEGAATRQLTVAVVERATPGAPLSQCAAAQPDLRVFAVTPASRRALQRGGAWDGIAATRAPRFERMQVWDTTGAAFLEFGERASRPHQAAPASPTPPLEPPPLGWIVENRVLLAALRDRLDAHAAAGRIASYAPDDVRRLELPLARQEPVVPTDDTWASPSPPPPPPPPPSVGASASAHTPPPSWLPPDSLARLTLASGETLSARLVVGADGGASGVRAAARIGTWGWDYDQRGVVATVRCAAAAGGPPTAYQRFLPSGPVALLPLWDDLYSVVWSTTPAHADELLGMGADAFAAALQGALHAPPGAFSLAQQSGDRHAALPTRATVGGAAGGPLYDTGRDAIFLDPGAALLRLGRNAVDAAVALGGGGMPPPPRVVSTEGLRAAFPLRFAKANAYVRPRVALIGDAAHTIHPLAGQGLNLGIGDADELADALGAAARAGADVGALHGLRRYERSRSAQNLMMVAAMEGVKAAFAGPAAPGAVGLAAALGEHWATARSLGLALLNASPAVKQGIARFAMGTR